MVKKSVLKILLIGANIDRLAALEKLLEKYKKKLLPRVWGEASEVGRQHLGLVIVDYFSPDQNIPPLLSKLRRQNPNAPILLIVRDFASFQMPSGISALDIVPMMPEVVSFKVETLVKIAMHEQKLRNKERKVDQVQERLDREMRYHQETERILRENEQTLRRIFHSIEATSEGILITEKNEIVYYANPAFETLTGFGVSDVFGSGAEPFFRFSNNDIDFTEMKKIARESGSWHGDVTLERKDGDQYQAYLDINAVFSLDGQFEGYIFIQRDITTLKELMTELETLARGDALTGLYNRRHFMERYHDELERVQRYAHPVALLLIDIDYFKTVNDTYGHGMGDRVLARFGMIINDLIRVTDFAGRYGGEEFCIALPETTLEGGASFGHRIREALAAEWFSPEHGDPFQVTCSIGVCEINNDHKDAEHELKLVDEALYRAKNKGRNRVEIVIHEPDPEPEAANNQQAQLENVGENS